MDHKRFRKKDGKSIIRAAHIFESALLCTGMAGIFLTLSEIPGIAFPVPFVLIVGIFVCILLSAAGIWRREWGKTGAAAAASLCGCAAIFLRRPLLSQAAAFFRSLTGTAGDQIADCTVFMVFLAVLTAVLFYVSEIICRQHWPPYLIVTAVIAGGPVFGIQTGIFPMLWGLAFQILFWTAHTSERKQKRRRKRKNSPEKSISAVRTCAFTGTVLLASVCISVIITALWGNNLSDMAYSGEGFILRNLNRISGNAENPAADGHISSGNLYRTGETQMTVTLTKEPTEPLYLKGFTGGEYTGGEWEEADDEALFHEMAQILDWEEWESWIRGMYYKLYFSMNSMNKERVENHDENQRSMFISYAEGAYSSDFFVPYYSMRLNPREYEGAGYGYQYYEEDEMDIDWENVPGDFETIRDWYRQVQQAYIQLIPDVYTGVPETILPRLASLCRGRTFQSSDEVTAYILSVLQSEVSYTLTPGRAPLNEDIIEYFLFESHEGYCVHFASAATLMYRLCGVPARYASGYMLLPSDFTLQEDGTWQTEVTDESAHAWTEIFLEDYGWVPVDMTPSSDGQAYVAYPGLDTALLEQMVTSAAENINMEENDEEDSDSYADAALRTGAAEESGGREVFPDLTVSPEIRKGISVVLCEIVILAPAIMYGYRIRKRRRAEQMNCRQIFTLLLSVLHKKGYMTGYNGNENDFAEKLAKEVPCINKKEAKELIQIVSRAAYGKDGSKKEEDKFVHDIFSRVCRLRNAKEVSL